MKPAVGAALVLWRVTGAVDVTDLAGRLDALAAAQVRLYLATEGAAVCVYAEPAIEAPVAAVLTASAECSRLICIQQLAGASAGAEAPWHYVVETDVLPAYEADFNAWYEHEHLPGLAAVPGTVSAARFVREGPGGPRYRACYELASIETFGSAPWLAVRASAWSARVRPAFRETRRTMFERVRSGSPIDPR